jgi:ribulose-5-phosphate 4-epimerase/fuculose-1-phosphate aldolase
MTGSSGAPEIVDLRRRVAQACRVLGRLELTKAATGHISARVPGTDRILIRARGPDELGVRYTTDEQVIEIDLDGRPAGEHAKGLAAPIEVFIHTELYRSRPEVHAVVHMHPPTVVLFTICDKPLLPIYGAFDPASAQLALDGIPTFDSSVLIQTAELGAQLAQAMDQAKVCLMRGHGITTAGPSVEEAALLAIQLNELATMNYQAHLLGDPRPISAPDQAAMRSMKPGPSDSVAGDPPRGRLAALWRYYCAVTGADKTENTA